LALLTILAVAAIAACAAVAPATDRIDPAVSADVARAVLERIPQWPGAQVEIPIEVYADYIEHLILGPQPPQPPQAVVLSRAACTLTVSDDAAELEVSLDVVSLPTPSPLMGDGNGRAPSPSPLMGEGQGVRVKHATEGRDNIYGDRTVRLLPASVAWEDVRLGDAPAELRRRGAWFVFDAPKPGEFRITARATLKATGAAGGGKRICIPAPPAVITLVTVAGEGAWEADFGPRSPLRITGGPDGTRGTVGLAPGDVLDVTWRRPQPQVRRAARIETLAHVGWTLAEGVHQVRAELDLRLWGGETAELALSLPPAADRVAVAGPDVREVQVEGGSARVFLRGAITQRTRLSVSFEMPRTHTGRMTLPAVAVDGATARGGEVAVAGGSEGVLLELESPGLDIMALRDLADRTRSLVSAAPVYAYRIAGPWEARMDLVGMAEFPVRETLIDSALYTVLYRPDGHVMTKVIYEVRNRARQYMQVALPPGARLLVARVSEEQRSPARGPDGSVYVPLEKSVLTAAGLVSFPVELVYLAKAPPLEAGGEFRLSLPRVDLPVAYARCALMLPDRMRPREWRGVLHQTRTWSSETAEIEFEYGRGHAARAPDTPPPPPQVEVQTTVQTGLPILGNLFTPTAPAGGEQVQAWWAEADQLRRAMRYDDAVSVLDRVLAADPTSERAMRWREDTLYLRGQSRQAGAGTQPGGEVTRGDVSIQRYPAAQPHGRDQTAAQPDAGAVALNLNAGFAFSDAQREAIRAKNAYRAATQHYSRGNYAKAGELFEQTIAAAPQSSEADNARKYLGNVQVALGRDDKPAGDRGLRAATKAVQLAQQEANAPLRERQQAVLERAEQAKGKGDVAAAEAAYKVAVGLGEQLRSRGEEAREQTSLTREAQEYLKARAGDRAEHEKRVEDLRRQVASLRSSVSAKAGKDVTQALEALAPDAGRDGFFMFDEAAPAPQVQLGQALAEQQVMLEDARIAAAPGVATSGRGGRATADHGAPRGWTGEAQVDRLQKQVEELQSLSDTLDAPTRDESGAADAPTAGLEFALRGKLVRKAEALATGAGRARQLAAEGRLAEAGELVERLAKEEQVAATAAVTVQGGAAGRVYIGIGAIDADGDGAALSKAQAGIAAARLELRKQAAERETVAFDISDLAGAAANGRKLADFVAGNYAWNMETSRDARPMDEDEVVRTPGTVDGPAAAADGAMIQVVGGTLVVANRAGVVANVGRVLERLRANMGQRVAVASQNVLLDEAAALAAGVEWRTGAGGARYAVINDGQWMSLLDLAQRRGRASGGDAYQEAVVGTDARLANGWGLGVSRADDQANGLAFNGNAVDLPHDDVLLVSNGRYLTAVKTGRMRHWSADAERVRLPGVPAAVTVPDVGRTVKFEKTLLEASDPLELTADYTMQGD
jgi:tetratricopeptide (TPR) repeat protein